MVNAVETPFTRRPFVCPWWLCFTFDNFLRRIVHRPEAILGRHVHPGDRVIDIGAGMGYFTIPLAKLVGPGGHVEAIDVQPKMLSALQARALKNNVSQTISAYLGSPESLGSHPKADFILAFWMVHEVTDPRSFLKEVRNLLKSGGLFLLVEPKAHTRRKHFMRILQTAADCGFVIKENPRIRFSRSTLLGCGENGPRQPAGTVRDETDASARRCSLL